MKGYIDIHDSLYLTDIPIDREGKLSELAFPPIP